MDMVSVYRRCFDSEGIINPLFKIYLEFEFQEVWGLKDYEFFNLLWMFSVCLQSWKYITGNVIEDNVVAETYQECLNKCRVDEDCRFWDFHNRNCRLLSNEGNGPVSGYDGAVAGKKNCIEGPKRMFSFNTNLYLKTNTV